MGVFGDSFLGSVLGFCTGLSGIIFCKLCLDFNIGLGVGFCIGLGVGLCIDFNVAFVYAGFGFSYWCVWR